MNAALGSLAKRSLLASGYYRRRLRRDVFPGVAVLCYHGIRRDACPPSAVTFEGLHVSVGELETHCRLVRESCHPISLDQWRAALVGGPPLPARPVLFTFDDGYRTVFSLARPILERYAIPAVVFVCSEPIEQRRLLWHDAVARVHGEAEVERIKALPFEQWESLRGRVSAVIDDSDPNAPLTVAEVKALARGLFEIGGHTAAHAIMARAQRKQQREQILKNRTMVEAWIGRSVTAFAYPNGRPGFDYTPESVQLVEEAGFDFAFTTRAGFAVRSDSPLECARFLMLAGISAAELAHRLAFSWRA
jgi:peptidoglycan/xylan/chitin deacetylase (PgdA/CDA1 family)